MQDLFPNKNEHVKKRRISPYLIIVSSFLLIILMGSLLLLLPISKKEGEVLKFIDAFFISTSAVTITGLSPLSNLAAILSPFGKVVVAILIQIGGLSVVTLSVFVMYLIGAKIGITNRILIKESFNQNSLSGMVKLVVKIVIFSLSIEFLGFIINLIVLIPNYPLKEALGLSAFHAISAFNNCGLDIFGSNSLQNYSSNVLLNLNTAALIMLGGLGFVVLNDLITKKSYKKLMIHSKIVITMNLILWTFGTIIFLFSEDSLNKLTFLEAFFLSVSARTAGFSNINISSISALTTLMLLILMFIGASPASTGGGIKVTTLYTLFKGTSSYALGRETVTHKRLIGIDTKNKASVLLTISLSVIAIGTILLLILEDVSLDIALVEIVSAFANVGLSKGLTVNLSNSSKILISFIMFIGRAGPLTVISLLNKTWYKEELDKSKYIEEKIVIG